MPILKSTCIICWLGVWLDSLKAEKEKKKHAQAEEETPITRMPRKVYFPLTAVFILWVAMAWILITWTAARCSWTDGFTTALSVVAMWMLARKVYLEQWEPAWTGCPRDCNLQGAVFHFGTVALCGSGLFRMEKVAEPDDGTGM